jgi:hypothetical protein
MTDTYGTFDPADRPGSKVATPEGLTLLDEDGQELPAFDGRFTEAFKGLAFLGALTARFSWLGHEFVIRTLGVNEQLAVAQVTDRYKGTGEQLAYATAVVAMCVVTVDGQELPTPIGEDQQLAEWAHKRFAYVKDTWFQYTINQVFQEYLKLEDLVGKVIEAMGKALGPAA